MAFKFSNFVEEGSRRRKKRGLDPKPFDIELSDGNIVSLDYPDANTYLALGNVGEKDTLGQLRVLFRKNPRGYNQLIDELEGVPVEALGVLLEDMWEFWDRDENSIPGKSKA